MKQTMGALVNVPNVTRSASLTGLCVSDPASNASIPEVAENTTVMAVATPAKLAIDVENVKP